VLACPACRAPLRGPDCPCGQRFTVQDGILDLYLPAPEAGEGLDVTRTVRAFYEDNPFPAWKDGDGRDTLLRAGRDNPFLAALDRSLPPGARVVEAGCGTGQLSCFLALGGREVLGLDLSLASLRNAEAFRQRAGLRGLRFVRANLFRPPLAPASVDCLVSNGVLHHTADTRAAFSALAPLVRPGGLLLIGLYNRWGRALLRLRAAQDRRRLDDATRGGGDLARARAWYLDQHAHPHERTHTADEVLAWFDAAGFDVLRTVPPLAFGADDDGRLDTPAPIGGWLERRLVQWSWLPRAADGGLWVTVGRRRG